MLLSWRLKHAATWQRCHSNKAAAVVAAPVQRGNTYMFLFSFPRLLTNHCLIPLYDQRRFAVYCFLWCGGERSPELLAGHLCQVEYGRCERDAGTLGNQNELLWMAWQIITTLHQSKHFKRKYKNVPLHEDQTLHWRKEAVTLFNPVPVVLQTTTDVTHYSWTVCERHLDHHPHQWP